MTTLIDKTVDILTKQAKKIPQVMILILLFVVLFSKEAVNIIDFIIAKVQLILPEVITDFWGKMSFTQKDFLTIWAFLLVLNAFTVILDVLHQIIDKRTRIDINSMPVLFTMNSVIFLSVLIYNRLYEPNIKISDGQFTDIYSLVVLLAGFCFTFLFCMVYGADIIEIYKKIKDSELSKKKQYMLYIIYWLFIGSIFIQLLSIF